MLTWPLGVVWAAVSADGYNRRLDRRRAYYSQSTGYGGGIWLLAIFILVGGGIILYVVFHKNAADVQEVAGGSGASNKDGATRVTSANKTVPTKRQQLPLLSAQQHSLWQKFRQGRSSYVVAGYSLILSGWLRHGVTPLEPPADDGLDSLFYPVNAMAADIYAKEWVGGNTPATAVIDFFSREEPVIDHCYVDTRQGRIRCDRPLDSELEMDLYKFIRQEQINAISK